MSTNTGVDPVVAGQRFAERIHLDMERRGTPIFPNADGDLYRGVTLVTAAFDICRLDPRKTLMRMLSLPKGTSEDARWSAWRIALKAAEARYDEIYEALKTH